MPTVAVGSDKEDTQHVSCGSFAGRLVEKPDGNEWAEDLQECGTAVLSIDKL